MKKTGYVCKSRQADPYLGSLAYLVIPAWWEALSQKQVDSALRLISEVVLWPPDTCAYMYTPHTCIPYMNICTYSYTYIQLITWSYCCRHFDGRAFVFPQGTQRKGPGGSVEQLQVVLEGLSVQFSVSGETCTFFFFNNFPQCIFLVWKFFLFGLEDARNVLNPDKTDGGKNLLSLVEGTLFWHYKI